LASAKDVRALSVLSSVIERSAVRVDMVSG
jgi:hypothetical protein